MKIILLISFLFLQSCTGLGIFNETIKTGSEAVTTVKKADAVQSVGNAAEKLADAQIKKQETKQLKIKENSDALQTAVQLLNQIKDENNKLKIGNKLLQARMDRIAGEQETLRTQYRTNAWFWGMAGLLGGFILSILFKSLANAGARVEGNLKINKKEI
jgi:hypothetical protein